MKNTFTLILLLSTTFIWSQIPNLLMNVELTSREQETTKSRGNDLGFKNKYATIVDIGSEYDPSKEFYYPTTVTVDISAGIINFEYLDKEKDLTMNCRIYDYDTRADEYTDIYTKANDKKIRFRFYDDSIYVIFTDIVLILNN